MQALEPQTTIERLTTTEVLALLRISRATLWRRIAEGRLPRPQDHGREALFCKAAVVEAALRDDERLRSFAIRTENRLEWFRRRKGGSRFLKTSHLDSRHVLRGEYP